MPKVFDGKVFDKLDKELGTIGDGIDKSLAGAVDGWAKTARIKKAKKVRKFEIRDIQLGKKGW